MLAFRLGEYRDGYTDPTIFSLCFLVNRVVAFLATGCQGGTVGFSANSINIESVTPEKAREFAGYNYAHNRPMRPWWVKFLANEMREGRFMPTAEIHIVYRNGEPVLVNGQHTCAAIALYNKPVRVTVRKTSTTEPGQIAMLYAYGHDNGLKRTFVDGLGAYNIGEEYGLGPTRLAELNAALRHIRSGFYEESRNKSTNHYEPSTITEMVEMIPQWVPFFHMFWNQIEARTAGGKIKALCSKRGSLSVVLTTLRYQTDTARVFWQGVVEDDGIMVTDPRFKARQVLENSKNTPYTAKKTSAAKLSRELARCWRGFLDNEKMMQVPKGIREGDPISIVGTPYNGKQPEPPWWPE